MHVEKEGELEFAEGAVMMDMFAGRGLDFVVDCGMRVRPLLCSSSAVPSGPGCVGRIGLILYPSYALLVEDIYKILHQACGLLLQEARRTSDLVSGWQTDVGTITQVSEGSTVIDLTSKIPSLVRDGKGDASVFVPELVPV